MRWVQDTYMGYKASTRHLQGIQGGYKTPTWATRQVQDTYNGYKVGTRALQGVQDLYESPTRV